MIAHTSPTHKITLVTGVLAENAATYVNELIEKYRGIKYHIVGHGNEINFYADPRSYPVSHDSLEKVAEELGKRLIDEFGLKEVMLVGADVTVVLKGEEG